MSNEAAGAMWFAGVSLDCAEPQLLAEFYRELLGGELLWRSADSAGVRVPGVVLAMQRVAGYQPPAWPGSSIVHLDLAPAAGADAAAATARAVRAGAVLPQFQPDPRWRVLLDPAGHPFCITTKTPPGGPLPGGSPSGRPEPPESAGGPPPGPPPVRPEPPQAAGERATLSGFLAYQRATLAGKCAGLSAGQLRGRAVPPSALSLLGLLRHLAEVERSWFRNVLAGEPGSRPVWEAPGRPEFDVDAADAAGALRAWQEECARSDAIIAAAASLDVSGSYDGEAFSLRYILVHMIEEYARHNGHADLIRERIDGSTGE